MKNKLTKNIKIDYIYSFLKNFDISGAIWVLYMVHKGLPLWQIGIVEGAFHVASFIFEVPSGALADMLGRKKAIIIGRICSALSAIVSLFANNMFLFIISFVISALGYNMNSGSEEALVYDSLKLSGKEEDYIKINSRLNIIIEVALGISTFLGGVLAEYSFVHCYGVAILIAIVSLIPAFCFTEPNLGKSEDKKNISLISHFKICFHIIKTNKEILKILVYFSLIFTFDTVVYYYGQEYFNVLGLNKIQISLVMLGAGIVSCLGALSSEYMMNKYKEKTKHIFSLLMGLCIILISGKNLIISIIFFAIMAYGNAVLYPIQSLSLNELIPSEQRATIISVSGMFFSLAMMILFPLCGLLADLMNLHIAFLVIGILQLFFIILFIIISGRTEMLAVKS